MRADPTQPDPAVVLATGAGVTAGEGAVELPRLAGVSARLHRARARVEVHPLAGRCALAALMLCSLAVVLVSTSGPSALVPRSHQVFPGWEAGPLHGIVRELGRNSTAVSYGLTAVLVIMTIAYLVVLASVRTMSMRVIAVAVVVLHAILVLGPPLRLTDLFNYLGYARLGGVHALNPYTHVIAGELHDPIYRFATWYHLKSPYGPLFTVISYPLSFLPLATAYWVIKVTTVLASLCFVWLVFTCARLLGRDPRFAVVFVAANPVFLMYAIAEYHNDFFMLIPSTAAVALVLARRDRSAGAALMIAVAVKFTAVVLLPFLLLAVATAPRRRRIITGALIAAVPLAAMQLSFFGLALPDLADQSTLLTSFSIPNVLGSILGIGGGTPELLRLANVALVLVVALLLRQRRDWLAGAGWSTFALIATLAWLVPWYLIWLLPLAALSTSLRLRRVALAFTVYLVVAFTPLTGKLISDLGIHLMGGPAGQASLALQIKLEH